jgi:hypothetical protein
MKDADTMSLQYYPERDRDREREREREREAPPYYNVINPPHPQRGRECVREIQAQQHSPQSYTYQPPETHQAYTHASSTTSQTYTLSPHTNPYQPPETHQDPSHRHPLQSIRSITPTAMLGRGVNPLSTGSTHEFVDSTHESVQWLHSTPQRSAMQQSPSFQPPLYRNG